MYLVDHVYQCEVAQYYKVTPALVSKLVQQELRDPMRTGHLKGLQAEKHLIREAIKKVVTRMLENNVPIVKADMVVRLVSEQEDTAVTIQQVQTVMRDDLGLAYRLTKKIPVQANQKRCLVLRQQYAMTMLPLLRDGRRFCNIDETWLQSTNFTRKAWSAPGTAATIPEKPISYRIAMIAALDTDGHIYYALTQANTDQNVMLIYLQYLVEQMDLERPDWRDDTVLLLDGARYHTGSAVREYLRKLEVQVIWSGPYSYSAAPIEMVFGALKFGELNPDKKPTGKKVSAQIQYLTNLL